MAKFKMRDHVQAVRSDGSRSPFMGRIVKMQVNENDTDVLNSLVPGFPMADLAIKEMTERKAGKAR
jgi:hypothetical protein